MRWKMLDQELYNRVIVSEKMRCWKNYLIEKRLEWKEPCPFKEWSKQFVGEEHNCVEKDIPMPPAKPVVGTGTTANSAKQDGRW